MSLLLTSWIRSYTQYDIDYWPSLVRARPYIIIALVTWTRYARREIKFSTRRMQF